ncbi:MAG: pyruvate, phosphate dikinase [Fusobacteriaceae bacterium]
MNQLEKRVYMFNEGDKTMKNLLGGKGANLCEMTKLNLPVPEGFIITTACCREYIESNLSLSSQLLNSIDESLKILENRCHRNFGGTNPLLLSVRSGAPVSMPGMMDTLLNLGFNDKTLEAVSNEFNNRKFALDSYSRFIEMFSDIVKKFSRENFTEIDLELEKKYSKDSLIFSEKRLELYKEIYFKNLGEIFPQDVKSQLLMAIEAIFLSWNNNRAKVYRELNNIDENMGTAVNVQRMVFGNLNEKSATGVAFSRNPANGENKIFGEYLPMAQGEDIVAGIRTPLELEDLSHEMPEIYSEFHKISKNLELHYKDMQDIEFTIEDGKLFILQTRNGKRAPFAGVKIALDLIDEGIIDEETALLRIDGKDISKLLKGNFKKESLEKAIYLGKGLAGSAGVATGKVIFTSEEISDANCILVRNETSPEDLRGMSIASGILTSKGGLTSHGAVVARGMGKCCVAGCSDMVINLSKKEFYLGGVTVKEGDLISIDGYTGHIYHGLLQIDKGNIDDNFRRVLSLAVKYKKMGVRMNADTPEDCAVGLKFHVEGIGLCRTEHMFFKEDRIWAVREMILSTTLEERKIALEKILPYQEDDFYHMMKLMDGKPINIRLLDPPLHEFLPVDKKDIELIGKIMKISVEEAELRIRSLEEHNPMLGHRGCRLAVTFPEIYEIQVKAVATAALRCLNEGIHPHVEIMIPLVSEINELKFVKSKIIKAIEDIDTDKKFRYSIGTMIELPRACVVADELAEEAEFFSFGTNDLTQTSYGLSRDDSGKFIEQYKTNHIFENSPFEVLDRNGVGKLMKLAIDLGKKSNPNISLGICGEHGGEERSISFCNELALDYISCSPYRVPAALLAAAQSAIKSKL